jgi:hypothetical protein
LLNNNRTVEELLFSFERDPDPTRWVKKYRNMKEESAKKDQRLRRAEKSNRELRAKAERRLVLDNIIKFMV